MKDAPKPVQLSFLNEADTCPRCGLTRAELYAHGHMGCARCYETFAPEVQRALKEIHGEDRHTGKSPQ